MTAGGTVAGAFDGPWTRQPLRAATYDARGGPSSAILIGSTVVIVSLMVARRGG